MWDCAPTWQAASHVVGQTHAIRAGTGELGGVGVDLWGRQAQILAATVGEGRSLTPVHSWGRRGRSDRRANGIGCTRAEVSGIPGQWQRNIYQGRGSPLGCVTLWNRTMSSGDRRFSATKLTSEPVRRLALKMASFKTSVQNTLSYG